MEGRDLILAKKLTDPLARFGMVEHLAEDDPFPGQGGRTGEACLPALEVSEKGQGPLTGFRS